jgi:hypothetical protein
MNNSAVQRNTKITLNRSHGESKENLKRDNTFLKTVGILREEDNHIAKGHINEGRIRRRRNNVEVQEEQDDEKDDVVRIDNDDARVKLTDAEPFTLAKFDNNVGETMSMIHDILFEKSMLQLFVITPNGKKDSVHINDELSLNNYLEDSGYSKEVIAGSYFKCNGITLDGDRPLRDYVLEHDTVVFWNIKGLGGMYHGNDYPMQNGNRDEPESVPNNVDNFDSNKPVVNVGKETFYERLERENNNNGNKPQLATNHAFRGIGGKIQHEGRTEPMGNSPLERIADTYSALTRPKGVKPEMTLDMGDKLPYDPRFSGHPQSLQDRQRLRDAGNWNPPMTDYDDRRSNRFHDNRDYAQFENRTREQRTRGQYETDINNRDGSVRESEESYHERQARNSPMDNMHQMRRDLNLIASVNVPRADLQLITATGGNDAKIYSNGDFSTKIPGLSTQPVSTYGTIMSEDERNRDMILAQQKNQVDKVYKQNAYSSHGKLATFEDSVLVNINGEWATVPVSKLIESSTTGRAIFPGYTIKTKGSILKLKGGEGGRGGGVSFGYTATYPEGGGLAFFKKWFRNELQNISKSTDFEVFAKTRVFVERKTNVQFIDGKNLVSKTLEALFRSAVSGVPLFKKSCMQVRKIVEIMDTDADEETKSIVYVNCFIHDVEGTSRFCSIDEDLSLYEYLKSAGYNDAILVDSYFMCEGHIMMGDMAIKNYGLERDSTIFWNLRVRGGMMQNPKDDITLEELKIGENGKMTPQVIEENKLTSEDLKDDPSLSTFEVKTEREITIYGYDNTIYNSIGEWVREVSLQPQNYATSPFGQTTQMIWRHNMTFEMLVGGLNYTLEPFFTFVTLSNLYRKGCFQQNVMNALQDSTTNASFRGIVQSSQTTGSYYVSPPAFSNLNWKTFTVGAFNWDPMIYHFKAMQALHFTDMVNNQNATVLYTFDGPRQPCFKIPTVGAVTVAAPGATINYFGSTVTILKDTQFCDPNYETGAIQDIINANGVLFLPFEYLVKTSITNYSITREGEAILELQYPNLLPPICYNDGNLRNYYTKSFLNGADLAGGFGTDIVIVIIRTQNITAANTITFYNGAIIPVNGITTATTGVLDTAGAQFRWPFIPNLVTKWMPCLPAQIEAFQLYVAQTLISPIYMYRCVAGSGVYLDPNINLSWPGDNVRSPQWQPLLHNGMGVSHDRLQSFILPNYNPVLWWYLLGGICTPIGMIERFEPNAFRSNYYKYGGTLTKLAKSVFSDISLDIWQLAQRTLIDDLFLGFIGIRIKSLIRRVTSYNMSLTYSQTVTGAGVYFYNGIIGMNNKCPTLTYSSGSDRMTYKIIDPLSASKDTVASCEFNPYRVQMFTIFKDALPEVQNFNFGNAPLAVINRMDDSSLVVQTFPTIAIATIYPNITQDPYATTWVDVRRNFTDQTNQYNWHTWYGPAMWANWNVTFPNIFLVQQGVNFIVPWDPEVNTPWTGLMPRAVDPTRFFNVLLANYRMAMSYDVAMTQLSQTGTMIMFNMNSYRPRTIQTEEVTMEVRRNMITSRDFFQD